MAFLQYSKLNFVALGFFSKTFASFNEVILNKSPGRVIT